MTRKRQTHSRVGIMSFCTFPNLSPKYFWQFLEASDKVSDTSISKLSSVRTSVHKATAPNPNKTPHTDPPSSPQSFNTLSSPPIHFHLLLSLLHTCDLFPAAFLSSNSPHRAKHAFILTDLHDRLKRHDSTILNIGVIFRLFQNRNLSTTENCFEREFDEELGCAGEELGEAVVAWSEDWIDRELGAEKERCGVV